MASKHVEETIQAHFEANWPHSDVPIFTENLQGQAPPSGEPFVVIQFPVTKVTRLSLGSRRYLEEGGFRILIHVPRGSGDGQMRDWGEEIATMFRDQTIGGVHCLVPTGPHTDDDSDQGAMYAGAMIVEFWWQFTG